MQICVNTTLPLFDSVEYICFKLVLSAADCGNRNLGTQLYDSWFTKQTLYKKNMVIVHEKLPEEPKSGLLVPN